MISVLMEGKIINKDYCDGCFALDVGRIGENSNCHYFNYCIARTPRSEGIRHIRPDICKDENGKKD